MQTDSLLQLIDTTLSFDTNTFLRDLVHLALLSADPKSIIYRFMVQGLTHVKDPHVPQHEFVVIELIDTHRKGSEPLLMFLECTASNNRPDSDYFFSHPDYATVLESIVQTIKDTPTLSITSLEALKISRSNDSSSSPLPLFDSTHGFPLMPLPSYYGEPESTSYLPMPSPLPSTSTPLPGPTPSSTSTSSTSTPLLQLPWLDTATLTSTKVVHASMQSTNKNYRADDRFVGAKNTKTYVPSLLNLRQIRLQSQSSFSLFELAVLADAVHNHDPLYSIYACTMVTSKCFLPVSQDNICIPRNDYLPDLAGRWMGILVSRVEEAVVLVVASNFREYRQEKHTEVHFILDYNTGLAKFWTQIQTRWEEYHHTENALKAKVSRLERVIRAHNLDPNIDIEPTCDDDDEDVDSERGQ